MMTVDEVSQRAKTLERTFLAMLVEFEKTTGCIIDRIDFGRLDTSTYARGRSSDPKISILVRIPSL